jgi:type I restriction enzyme S subunit
VSVSDDALVAFVPMNVIPKDYRESLNPEIRLWTEIKRGYTHFADGDIVVAKITPCFQNGKACVMKDLPGGVGAGTTELHVLRPVPNTVIPLYMLLIFKSPEFVNGGVASFTGTAGQQRVSTDYFRYCPIPLPPLAEQKRIVAKVEELMGLCDALEAQQQERELRKSVLVRSSLSRFSEAPTPENLGYLFHKSYDIPPSELRKSILTLAVQGKLVPFDTEGTTQTVGEHIDFQNGFAFKSQWFTATGTRLCRNVNVSHGFLDWKESVSVDEKVAHDFQRFALCEGDIVLSLDRPLIATGLKIARVRQEDLPSLLLQRVARLTPKHEQLSRSYIFLWLNSTAFVDCIDPGRSNGVPHISTRQVQQLAFSVPPLAEQHRIVAKVDQLMALVDELERQQEASRDNASKLLDAIVQEMTSGDRDIAATLES